MAAMDILQIVRQTLADTDVNDDDMDDTFIPSAVKMFEALTNETVTISSRSSSDVSWDLVIAYFVISIYYNIKKEAHLVSTGDLPMSASEWWIQVAFRRLVTIGYSEFFDYAKSSGLYTPKAKNIPIFGLCAVSDMSGGYGDEI